MPIQLVPWTQGSPPPSSAAFAWASACVALLLSSCLLDDNRCDAYQVPRTGDLTVCECAPNAIRDPRGYGCKPCGANEEVTGNACVCKAGFARATPESACEESRLGAACSGSEPCPMAYPYCATDRGAGYCTQQGCSTSADCAEGWYCQTGSPMNYCSKPPTGQGKPCETSADCSGEASYCEAIESKTCLVPNCATGENRCFGDYTCCDINMAVATIPSLCVPPVALTNGVCPLGVRKVEP